MPNAVRGALSHINFSTEKTTPMSAFNRRVFINQYPLTARIPRFPIGADKFEIITHRPRTESYTLASVVADDAATTFAVTDGSTLLPGDVLRVTRVADGAVEHVEVQSVTITNTSTGAANVVVLRGAAGTTKLDESAPAEADAIPTTALVRLVGNSRFGNEINQTAIRMLPTKVTQYLQRYQHPVEVGGRAQAVAGSLTLPGGRNPLADQQAAKLVDMYEDMERNAFYGIGIEGTASERAKSHGLRQLISAASNVVTSPTSASSYYIDDLIVDMFTPVVNNHGLVDIIYATPAFFRALFIWGLLKVEISPEDLAIGSAAARVYVPFHGTSVEVVPAPKLGTSTNITLVGFNKENLRMRVLEDDNYTPRGRRGDAVEGDWISDNALELLNPEQARWIENITGFGTS